MNRLLAIILLLAHAHQAAALTVTFKESAKVEKAQIRLGDIASFDGSTELAKALSTLVIGGSPPPGESVFLRSAQITHYLVSSHGVPVDIRWHGSPSVTVSRQGVTVGPGRVQSIIDDYLAANSNRLPDAEIRFLMVHKPLPFVLPTGELDYEVIPSNPEILGSSRFSIIFRVDGEVQKNMSVRGRLEALAEVVVAATRLHRGTILGPEHLTTGTVNVTRRSQPLHDQAKLVGRRLIRNVRSGDPVFLSHTEELPVVFRGQKVKMVVSSGALLLTATGLAHNDGSPGELIKVQNIRSNKIIYARVAAPGIVEVLL